MYSNSGGFDLWDTYNHTFFFLRNVCFFEAWTHIQVDIRKKKINKTQLSGFQVNNLQ